MQILESQWLRDRLREIPDEDLFPLVDVGSSTLDFRTSVQPYIEENIFAPLAARGGRVVHCDIKPAEGVELVGDLLDPAFRARIKDLGARSALVCNVLHHLENRAPLIAALTDIVPPGGHIVVSGPYQYPRHYDPIDTMFRPTPEQAAGEFAGTDLVAGEIIDAGAWRQWNKAERGGRTLPRAVARLCLPFYRPGKWLELARQSPYFFKHSKTFAIVLRRREGGAA